MKTFEEYLETMNSVINNTPVIENFLLNEATITLVRSKINSIILGLFDNPYFDKIKKETKSLSFFEFCTVLENQDFEVKSVKESVYNAMICCKKIVFLLDMVTKPLSEESITCWELRTVLNQEEFFNKTIFYKEGQIIKNQDVYETYNEY